ncbi:MAG: 50S ribosome-binding GTPase [Bacteriovoracaceae bacterium]|nr:50S ribosome-binding GTPase [Bacteriovoracaceae bacterium]
MKRSIIVSLIGRPNVGKSSIYNRLMKEQHRIMTYDLPGVTRDRHYGIMKTGSFGEYESEDIILVDTGGFYPEQVETDEDLKRKNNYEPFFNIMRDQAKIAIAESDLILLVVDVREGLLPYDKSIADYLRATKKPFWLIVNKYDTDVQAGHEAEFYELGLFEDQFLLTSAEHNRGIRELSERLCVAANKMKNSTQVLQSGVTPNFDVVASVAIIGAPNVGKSTLLNQLLGESRALVSDIAGTTIDPIEGYIDLDFGKASKLMTEQENEFRKHNKELLEAYRTFLVENDSLVTIEEAEELGIDYNLGGPSPMVEEMEIEASEEEDEIYKDDATFEPDTTDAESIDLVEPQLDLTQIPDEEEDINIPESEDGWRTVKIVDTAGIRRSKAVEGHIEGQAVYRSLRAIAEADVIIFMMDSTKGITHQDRRLIDIAFEKGKSLILTMNKSDLIQDILNDRRRKKDWMDDLRASVPWLDFCEIVPLSALKGSHMKGLMGSLKRTILIRHRKVPTPKLNKLVTTMVEQNPIILQRSGTTFKVKYASMVKNAPPTFMLFVNKSKGVPVNYRRFLVNAIRREFQIINTPVHLVFRTAADLKKNLTREDRVERVEE